MSLGMPIRKNVRSLEELFMPQMAHRAMRLVRGQYALAEPLLVESLLDQPRHVPPATIRTRVVGVHDTE